MVQVIENGTDIRCTVLERRPAASLPDYDELTLRVDGATSIAGLADLISQRVGDTIDLRVARSLLPHGSLEGWQLSCRAKMAGPGVYIAEKDPPPERFQLTPP
jgi:hypothetical protein